MVILSRPALRLGLRVFHLAAVFWGFYARLRIGSHRGVIPPDPHLAIAPALSYKGAVRQQQRDVCPNEQIFRPF
jgi:hypothetical protein